MLLSALETEREKKRRRRGRVEKKLLDGICRRSLTRYDDYCERGRREGRKLPANNSKDLKGRSQRMKDNKSFPECQGYFRQQKNPRDFVVQHVRGCGRNIHFLKGKIRRTINIFPSCLKGKGGHQLPPLGPFFHPPPFPFSSPPIQIMGNFTIHGSLSPLPTVTPLRPRLLVITVHAVIVPPLSSSSPLLSTVNQDQFGRVGKAYTTL